MKKQSGFTLIELVIVIIILGILAATAVPKFIDLQDDARNSALKGVKAALEGGATLAYSRASINGIKTGSISMGNTTVSVTNGYPDATESGIAKAVNLSTGDWSWSFLGKSAVIKSGGTAAKVITEKCIVTYALGGNLDRPTITVNECN